MRREALMSSLAQYKKRLINLMIMHYQMYTPVFIKAGRN